MHAKAFISHTEDGGTIIGEIIQNQLIRTLEMESFLSKNSIEHGEYIPQKILEYLIKTDVLFVIIEPLVAKSKWVKWEYEFCKKRNIRVIPIVVNAFSNELDQINWLDTNEKYIIYDFRDEKLRVDVWDAIKNIRGELEMDASKRNETKLKANADTSDSRQNIVQVSGQLNFLTGNACIHIPQQQGKTPPIITKQIGTIAPDSTGKFNLMFSLSTLTDTIPNTQKCFIEIKSGKKSKLIPIPVNKQDGSSGDFLGKDSTNGLNALKPSKTIDEFFQDINEKIEIFSAGTVQSTPRTIKEKTIDRSDKISEITEILNHNDRIAVTGDKGSGKSALMCQLYEKLKNQHMTLFLRCDDYLGIDSLEQLNNNIVVGFNFIDLIQKIATKSDKFVIIFDSLDALSRNEKSMNIFKQFLKNIWGTGKVQTISSVRGYDYEYSPSINSTDWGTRYELKLLNIKEINKTLADLGRPKISDELKNILAIPLNLKLMSLILEKLPNADFTSVTNEIELYDVHWNNYVEKLISSSEVRETLYGIAQSMASLQRVSISYDDFSDFQAIDTILSRGIIRRDATNNSIKFFHHAYLDYVISRFILAKYGGFVDYLQTDEYNVFLRPTVVFALSILNKRNPKLATVVIKKILNSELKGYWKISAITALAKMKGHTDQNFTELGNLLAINTVLQRHFLIEVTKHKNTFWFDLWNESFFVKWSSIDKGNSWFIVEYLKFMVESSHSYQHIFQILQLLVAKSKLGSVKREAIKLSSKLDVEGKADWLLGLSLNENAYIREGIVETLPKLIETNPEIVPNIFCNLFTYVETSDQKTQLLTYGTFGMTSTKRQDNYMVILDAGKLFPKLLEKNPVQMLLATIKIFEVLKKEELGKYEGNLIEDYGYIWFERSSFSDSYDENKLLICIGDYLRNNCSNEMMLELIAIFTSTRLATFYSILLESLVQRKNLLVDEVFQLLSSPKVYQILTLRKSVRIAIRKICRLLTQAQLEGLLDLVMNATSYGGKLDDQSDRNLRIKAEFLSEFPSDVLQMHHREILDNFSDFELEYKPPVQYDIEIGKDPEDVIDTKPDPESLITSDIGKQLNCKQKIDLLEIIFDYLGKKTKDLDNAKIPLIRKFLIENKGDPDPQDNTKDNGDGSFITIHSTIRGLVAKCLVRLLCHSRDAMLVPLLKTLAGDPINVVRGEICSVLDCLFDYDYDLAYSITQRYSIDPDPRIQFFLHGALVIVTHQNPKHATLIIKNRLDTLPTNNQKIQGMEGVLVYLAFYKKEKNAIDLLNKIVDDELFSPKIRCNIPFILKEGYLFKDEFQDKSLDFLYRMLGDSNPAVRYNACFFTLSSREREEYSNYKEYVQKIKGHLDRIVSEVDRQSWDPRLIEVLVRFLEKFWDVLPENTVNYLEKITDEETEQYSTYQPVLAEESVKILTGLFQHPSLSERNRKRCLDILDKYAMVGWNEALQLLSAMERPD